MIFKNKKWKRKNIITLLDRLEMYISSGLPIDKALTVSMEGLSPNEKQAISALCSKIQSGGNIANSFVTYLGISKVTAGIIYCGALSGTLSKSLSLSRTLLAREEELIKKIIQALIYPLIICLFAVVLTIGLIKGVMSQIIPLLTSLHIKLPIMTKVVILVSEMILKYGHYILISVIILIICAGYSIKKFSPIRKLIHEILKRIPLIGKLFIRYHLSVFLYSCGALVESGLPVIQAYERSVAGLSFLPVKEYLLTNSYRLEKGASLGSLFDLKSFPSFISPLLMAGETSGALGNSMLRAGNILDHELENSLSRLTVMIEPILMITLGLIVGSIAVSIMMPIYSVSNALQK